MCCFFGHETYRILTPQLGSEAAPPPWKAKSQAQSFNHQGSPHPQNFRARENLGVKQELSLQ